jgi:hypothetical protein
MTPLLAASVLFALGDLSVGIQNPKPPVTPLEGEWREPLLPVEKTADVLFVRVTGEEMTLILRSTVFRGSVQTGPEWDRNLARFRFVLTHCGNKPLEKDLVGLCVIQDGHLYLQVIPQPVPRPNGNGLDRDLAPVTFRLGRVIK